MRTVFRSLALFALAVAVVTAVGLSEAPALQKEKDKDKKAAEEVGTVEVYQAKDGWRFKVVNAEGKSVAIGTVGFEKKEDALKTLEFIKTTLNKAKVTEVKAPPKDDKKEPPKKDDKKQ